MAKAATIRPYKIDGPVTIEIEYTTRNALGPDAGLRPGAERTDVLSTPQRKKG
jgi:D-amino peptidase